MAKKQRRATPKPAPTRRQLSRWQRQMRLRRILTITAAVILIGLVSWAGAEYYTERVAPGRQVVIRVNDASFRMEYYVDMLDIYSGQADPEWIHYMAEMVADSIIDAEVMRQYAREDLGIEISKQEIDARLQEEEWPDDNIFRDIVRSILLQEKLEGHFDSLLREREMEHTHVRVMLVEDEEVADEVIAKIKAGGNFTALADEFSYHPHIKGDLGWLPEELMPDPLIADVALNLTPGELSEPVYDEAAIKNVGYWLIEVTDALDNEDDEREIEARAILLGSRGEAEQVRAKLAGGNFTALAKEYSQHPSADHGGELGRLVPGQMDSDAFDDAAFDLAINEVSEPVRDESVQTSGGFWIVEVLDRDERELEEEDREVMVQRRLNEWFEEKKEECTIKRPDEEQVWWAAAEVLRRR